MTRLARYAEAHKPENLGGPGDGRPTATQVIEDLGLVDSSEWRGRVVLVTGVSRGGLGLETARALHLTGADVYITARNGAQGAELAREIAGDGKPGRVDVVELDLGSLDSVRAAAAEFLQKSGGRLNVLINNAGISTTPEGKTKDGFELQFGTNHLGHFLLFHLLRDALVASSSPTFASRVVVVASSAHRGTTLDLEDLDFARRGYEPMTAYAQSKLANVLFANALDRRYGGGGGGGGAVRALSVHPGGILTGIVRHLSSLDMFEGDPVRRVLKNPAQGAATTVWAAVAPELEGKGGIYLEDVAEGLPVAPDAGFADGGYAPHAFDPPTEEKLWEKSLRMTGLKK